MKKFIKKLEKIANSDEFKEDAEKNLEKTYNEYAEYMDFEDTIYEFNDYCLYEKHFQKYEDEYYSFEEADYDFYDFAEEIFAEVLNKIKEKFIEKYKLEYLAYIEDE